LVGEFWSGWRKRCERKAGETTHNNWRGVGFSGSSLLSVVVGWEGERMKVGKVVEEIEVGKKRRYVEADAPVPFRSLTSPTLSAAT